MTIFISYLVSTRECRISPRAEGPRADAAESRGLIRDSRVDTWVRYENCHIVIFLSYILIHDYFSLSLLYIVFIYLFIYLFIF